MTAHHTRKQLIRRRQIWVLPALVLVILLAGWAVPRATSSNDPASTSAQTFADAVQANETQAFAIAAVVDP
ncbi:MAG: hypothetical protein D6775_15710, partial [Caldilineae bacterium]